MNVSWTNAMYEVANRQVIIAEALEKKGEMMDSWLHTVPARLAYLCDAVINIACLPWAICRFLAAGVYALVKWDRKVAFYVDSKNEMLERSNHFMMDCVGALVSTSLAHKYRDANITPYAIAIRYATIAALALYYGVLL